MNRGGSHYASTLAWSLFAATSALAHPLGNLSVNHFARIQPGARGVDATCVLDLGEMPVFELMQTWHVDRTALKTTASEHVSQWVANLSFRENGEPIEPELRASEIEVADSPGDLATMRVTLHVHANAKGGRFEFADGNYPSRPGWREIVIAPGPGAEITRASAGSADASSELRAIPEDGPLLNQRSAWMEWRSAPGLVSQSTPPVIVEDAPRIAAEAPPTPAPGRKQQNSSRNDAISRILREKSISLPVFVTLLALAFWFGALHALEPGHGKTMVAAYLVGSRGTPKHAALLGASVTFTHTASVFLLGIATLFVSRYVMPDKISRVLGIASGLAIVWIGAMLLWRRMRSLRAGAGNDQPHEHHHSHEHEHEHEHAHAHAHSHPHEHQHDHPHSHDHTHGHDHAHAHDPHAHAYTHTHGGHTHTHVPEGDISMRSLIALGASGGLVPCPSALILLLTAISLGRTGLGLILLCAFSAGLALVLTATGLAVLYAKRLIPERRRTGRVVRYMPVFSAAVIVIIGAVMTGVSLGWIPATRFTG